MSIWTNQLSSLEQYVNIMANGGYKNVETNNTDEIRADIAEVIAKSVVSGVSVLSIANDLCLTEACVRHHVNVLVASGAITMLSTSPRLYVSNENAEEAIAAVKQAAKDRKAKGRNRGKEAMQEQRLKNIEKTLEAIKRCKLISTTQLMEATGLRHEGIRLILQKLLDEKKVKRRKGARGLFWWSLK